MTEFFSILANDPIALLELCAVVLSFAYLLRLIATELMLHRAHRVCENFSRSINFQEKRFKQAAKGFVV